MMKTCGTASSFFAVAASALRTAPSIRAWGETLLLTGVLLLIFAQVGSQAGLFKIAFTDEWGEFILVAAIAIILPALLEELVFRLGLPALLTRCLPSPPLAQLLAVLAFIAWHPAQVWLGLPMAQPLFLRLEFLLLAGLLGVACTALLLRTGSIWPAVFLHWSIVVAWKGGTAPIPSAV